LKSRIISSWGREIRAFALCEGWGILPGFEKGQAQEAILQKLINRSAFLSLGIIRLVSFEEID
jgi:hypothetical protein